MSARSSQFDFRGSRTTGPSYLLLDEPTPHLVVGHPLAIMERVRALAAGGAGVIAVMHDLNLAAQFADEVVLLHAGQVVAAATLERAITADIIERPDGIVPVMLTHPQTHRPVVLPGTATAPPSPGMPQRAKVRGIAPSRPA